MKHLQLFRRPLPKKSKIFLWISCYLILLNYEGICGKVVNLSAGQDGIIAAFADFNADRLTDILVISKDQKSFHVLYQKETEEITDKILYDAFSCSVPGSIVSLIPGDFNGDTRIDVAVITKLTKLTKLTRLTSQSHSDLYEVRMISSLNKTCGSLSTIQFVSIIEPFMLDFNGDMICDFLAVEKGQRVIHLGGHSNSQFYFQKRETFGVDSYRISSPHSCAFVDTNRDNLVDIVITTEKNIEYWHGHINGLYGDQHKPSILIPYPHHEAIGQSIFMDINRDGKIEHIIPVIENGHSTIQILQNLEKDHWHTIYNLTSPNGTYHFKSIKYGQLVLPIALRAGDINNDGYPDLITILHDESNEPSICLFLNEEDKSSPIGRTFKLKKLMKGVKNPIIASFFDFAENGKLDLLVSAGNDTDSTELIVRENREVVEANFLKIIIASGRCPSSGCEGQWLWNPKDIVVYSSNLPGAQVSYKMDDINGVERFATSGQMKQSSHFALETPYMVFGLGELANYVTALQITLPSPQNNTNQDRLQHDMEQIIPDAHIIVVPRPMNEPKKWKARLYFTVGDRILRTVYTLLAICVALVLVIAVLHQKELREDAPEAKEFKQAWLSR